MTLYLVLTRLGFVQIFAQHEPTFDARHGWSGRRIERLDPLTVWALRLRRWLRCDEPRAMTFRPPMTGQPLHLLRQGQDVTILARWCWVYLPVITFCDRMAVVTRLCAADGDVVGAEFL